jgi:membrane protein
MAPMLAAFWRLVDGFISWSVGAAVFALIFKLLPEARVAWRDVWIGAVVTALLFAAGKFVFGFYLRWVSFDTLYGPAGALILVLVWAYYSAQIVLLGAEFTRAYAKLHAP